MMSWLETDAVIPLWGWRRFNRRLPRG